MTQERAVFSSCKLGPGTEGRTLPVDFCQSRSRPHMSFKATLVWEQNRLNSVELRCAC